MKHSKRVKLNFVQTLTHYGVVLVLLFVATLFCVDLVKIYITDTYEGVSKDYDLITGAIAFFSLAVVFAFIQYRRLYFKEVALVYTEAQFQEAVTRTVLEMEWKQITNLKGSFKARRHSNWTGSWGEMITVIKERDRLFINSICDPDKWSSIIAYGWNRKNVGVFLKNLNDVINDVPASNSLVVTEAGEWTVRKVLVRLILYPLSFFLVFIGGYMILQPTTFRTVFAGVCAAAIAIVYLYADLRMLLNGRTKS